MKVSENLIYCNLSIPLKMRILPNSIYSFNSLLSSETIAKRIEIDLWFVELINEEKKEIFLKESKLVHELWFFIILNTCHFIKMEKRVKSNYA